jgi:hypothetical protein
VNRRDSVIALSDFNIFVNYTVLDVGLHHVNAVLDSQTFVSLLT